MEPSNTSPGADRSDVGLAARLRGFGPAGILALLLIAAGTLLFLPLSALFVLLWARESHTPWRAIGLQRPRNWGRSVGVGLLFGPALKLLLKAVVMPLLGADAINHAFHYLAVTGELWMLMIAHAAFDLTAVVLIYNNLETSVAHWVFK